MCVFPYRLTEFDERYIVVERLLDKLGVDEHSLDRPSGGDRQIIVGFLREAVKKGIFSGRAIKKRSYARVILYVA